MSQRAGAALCVIAPHDVASFPYEAPAVRALADFAGVRRSKIHVRALPFVANPIGGDVPACVVACVREGDDGVGMLDLDGAHAALSRWGDVLVVPVSVREEGGPALIVTRRGFNADRSGSDRRTCRVGRYASGSGGSDRAGNER